MSSARIGLIKGRARRAEKIKSMNLVWLSVFVDSEPKGRGKVTSLKRENPHWAVLSSEWTQ
jgi:hypothetical protein